MFAARLIKNTRGNPFISDLGWAECEGLKGRNTSSAKARVWHPPKEKHRGNEVRDREHGTRFKGDRHEQRGIRPVSAQTVGSIESHRRSSYICGHARARCEIQGPVQGIGVRTGVARTGEPTVRDLCEGLVLLPF